MPTDMFEQICRGLKVLVVDDKSISRDLIKKILIEEGLIVVGEARDGEEALSLYEALKPDLVTMDINMPNMNGLRAIKKIMKLDNKANIIVVSGYQNSENKAREFGARDFLAKPFQPAFLINKIKRLVEDGAFKHASAKEEESIINIEKNAEPPKSEDVLDKTTQGVEEEVQSKVQESTADEVLSSEQNSKQDTSVLESSPVILADDEDEEDDLLSSIDFETGEGMELLEIKENEVLVIKDEDDSDDDMLISLPTHRAETKRKSPIIDPDDDLIIETEIDKPKPEPDMPKVEETETNNKVHKESKRTDIIVRPPKMNLSNHEESPDIEDLIIETDTGNGTVAEDKAKSKKNKNKQKPEKKSLFSFLRKK